MLDQMLSAVLMLFGPPVTKHSMCSQVRIQSAINNVPGPQVCRLRQYCERSAVLLRRCEQAQQAKQHTFLCAGSPPLETTVALVADR